MNQQLQLERYEKAREDRQQEREIAEEHRLEESRGQQ